MTNKTLTKADIAASVSNDLGFSVAESLKLVADVFLEIGKSLEKGDSVKISSFGTFSVKNKKERIGRNPKTKKEAVISARRVVTFHSSMGLRDIVNKSA